MMLFPDLPVYKRAKKSIQDDSINDGLHYGGIALTLRQRPGFQSNPFEVIAGVRQHLQKSFRLARHLHFPHDPARVVHDADTCFLD
jgi:hypothetical protein